MDGKKDQANRAVFNKRPPFPFEVGYIWNWFSELTLGLAGNGMGPVMASWGDILNWELAAGLELEPWERAALAKLSHTRAMVQSEVQAEAIMEARNRGASRKT